MPTLSSSSHGIEPLRMKHDRVLQLFQKKSRSSPPSALFDCLRNLEIPGLDLAQTIREYGQLRQALLEALERDEPLAREERDCVLDFIQGAMEQASAAFTEARDQELKRLRLAIDGAKLGIWSIDVPENKLNVDARTQELYGIRDGDNASDAIQRQVHPEDRERIQNALDQAMTQGAIYDIEYRVLHKDGRYHWVFARGEHQCNEKGEPISFSGVVVDICDRKNTEAQLDLERHKLKAIFEQSPAAMALWKGEDLVFEMVNAEYQAIFGSRQLLGKSFTEALPEFKDEAFTRQLSEVFKTGKPHIGYEVRAQIARAEGGPFEERYYDFTFVRVDDSQGKPYGVYEHAIDVTDRRTARIRLEESEAQIRLYAEALPVMSSIAGPTGELMFHNQRYIDYFGLEKGEALNWDWTGLDMIHPDDFAMAMERWKESIADSQAREIEYRLRRFDGEYRWHLARVAPAFDQDGKIYRWYATVVDIHEQKKVQEQLENAREELYQFFMQAPAPMVILSGPEHLFTLANPAYERMVGRRVRGKKVLEIFTLDEVSLFIPLLDGVYQTGEPFIGKELPLNIPDDDGTIKNHFVNVGYHAFRNRHGVIIGIFAVHQDVTEQVEARKLIEESASRFRMLANSMPQIVWTADPDGDVDWHNDWWYAYTGAQRGSQGDILESAMHPEDIELTAHRWQEALRTGQAYEIQYRFRRQSDGTYRWHLGRVVPVRNNQGQILLWLGTNTDIHDQKMLMDELELARADAERANTAKGTFLANMSHEIRTLLGAIIGFVDLLKDKAISSEEREQFLDTISRNGKSLTRIIDDILDLAKVESGKLEIEKHEFSFLDLMDEVLDLFRDRARSKGLYLRMNASNTSPARILSDPTRLRQIFINILGNAIKFTHDGGITVSIAATQQGEAKMAFTVKVKDTGIGITPEQKARLFQPFMQADSSTTRKFGGSGLGLALSQRLAKALDGDIGIENRDPNEGSGCTFVITFLTDLPHHLQIATTNTAAQVPHSGTEDKLPLAGVKVLVADDSPDNQVLAKRILARSGASVDIASNGVEALTMGLKNKYDLVLMDVQMPEMDGYEATRALRKAGFKRPILALTAHAMAEEKAKTRAAGCNGHLTKPLNHKGLIDTVKQHVLES